MQRRAETDRHAFIHAMHSDQSSVPRAHLRRTDARREMLWPEARPQAPRARPALLLLLLPLLQQLPRASAVRCWQSNCSNSAALPCDPADVADLTHR